jgi:hypothetical protein
MGERFLALSILNLPRVKGERDAPSEKRVARIARLPEW